MSNQPLAQMQIGLLTASIFENDGQNKPFYTVTLTRAYKQNDEWKYTHQLGHSDLPVAALLLTRAEEFIALAQKNS